MNFWQAASLLIGIINGFITLVGSLRALVDKKTLKKEHWYLLITGILAFIFIGAAIISWPHPQTSSNAPNSTNSHIGNQGVTVSSNTPTIAPSPTPTPITIKENLQIPCTECGSPLGLELQSIEINRNDNISAFHFKVTNNGSSLQSVNFQQLSLQDDNGNMTNAVAGDANAGNITYLGPTNSEIVIQTFPLALKPGVHYNMSVTIDSSTFKDQSITVSY